MVVLKSFEQTFEAFEKLKNQNTSLRRTYPGGAHPAETLNLLAGPKKNKFSPRFYVVAAADSICLLKAHTFEGAMMANEIYQDWEVGQSYITSMWTPVIALGHALWLMIKIRPQGILCNGLGTCVPICAIAFFFKVFGIRCCSAFYYESIARVIRLLLSGLLLYRLWMADQFLVQWPQLDRKYPRAHCDGCNGLNLIVNILELTAMGVSCNDKNRFYEQKRTSMNQTTG